MELSRLFITNFKEEMREVYIQAVEEFGDPNLIVKPEATHHAGPGYGGSLWFKYYRTDLSAFWRLFSALRLEMLKGE